MEKIKKINNQKLIKIISEYDGGKGSLIGVLQEIQSEIGYIPPEGLCLISKKKGIPESQIYGVITFYTQFRLVPHGKYTIKVCHGTACYLSAAEEITNSLSEELGVKVGGTTDDKLFTLETVSCLGACSLAPVMMINEETYGRLTPKKVREIVRRKMKGHK